MFVTKCVNKLNLACDKNLNPRDLSISEVKKMSQKEFETTQLDFVLNPANYGIVYQDSLANRENHDEKKQNQEKAVYNEVTNGLEKDLERLGVDLTYSAKILIGRIARNFVLLNRVKYQFICRGLLRNKTVLKPDFVQVKKEGMYPSNKVSKSLYYDNFIVFDSEEIHPIFDKLIPKLDRQMNEDLKSLGLLPVQQFERQKLTIIKKLRQKYNESIDKECTIKAETEKKINPKKKNQLQEINAR